MYADSDDDYLASEAQSVTSEEEYKDTEIVVRKEEGIYRKLFYHMDGPYQSRMGEMHPCVVDEDQHPINLMVAVPLLKLAPAPKPVESAQVHVAPQPDAPSAADHSTNRATQSETISELNFTSIDTPPSMKESPASKHMRDPVNGPGVLLPINPEPLNRSTLQSMLCDPTETATGGCPWYSAAPEGVFSHEALNSIWSLKIPRESIQVGYIEAKSAMVAHIAVPPGALRDALLNLIPNSRIPFDLATDSADTVMKAMLPFMKPKSRGTAAAASNNGADEVPIAAKVKPVSVTERIEQAEVAAARRANDKLRQKQVDPFELASFLLGRVVNSPSTPTTQMTPEDAVCVAAALRSSSQFRWLCIDFEAACVGKFESAVPIEVAVVEASVSRTCALTSAISLSEAAAARPLGEGPLVDKLVSNVTQSTSYYSLINPGQLNDPATAARLSIMACGRGKTTSLSGHGIPFYGFTELREDYGSIAAELVSAMALEHAVLLNKQGLLKQHHQTILIGKGPTLVELASLRWCLAAANATVEEGEVPLYDLSLEAALAMPLFDISAVAKLVGMVSKALKSSDTEPSTATGQSADTTATSTAAQLLKLPSDSAPKMLCACSYHWDLYSTGAAYEIAASAQKGLRDDFMIFIDDDEEFNEQGIPQEGNADEDIDVHCARADAFYLKLQVEDLISQLP